MDDGSYTLMEVGRVKRFRVVNVVYQREAAGHLHL
jgi:hypothetical protein